MQTLCYKIIKEIRGKFLWSTHFNIQVTIMGHYYEEKNVSLFPSVKAEAGDWKGGLSIPPGPMNVTFLYIHSTKSREVCKDIKIFNYRLSSLGNHSHGVRMHPIIWSYLLDKIDPLKVTIRKRCHTDESRYSLCRVIKDLGWRCPSLQQIAQIKNLCLASCILQVTCLQENFKTIHLSSNNQRTSVIITRYVCGRGFWQGCEQPAKDSKLH